MIILAKENKTKISKHLEHFVFCWKVYIVWCDTLLWFKSKKIRECSSQTRLYLVLF